MKSIFPFRYFQPSFCSGLFDDPLLLLRLRPKGNNILVDCGQLNHLAKRVLKSIQTLFISHAHMDHFIGFDNLARGVLVSNRTIEVIGPPGIANRVNNKLKSYDWNLIEDYYCRFKIREVYQDFIRIFMMDGSNGFLLSQVGEINRTDRTVFENSIIKVEAEICDHKIPVLIFKFIEKPIFDVDENKLEKTGIKKGPWLNQLKDWYYHAANSKGYEPFLPGDSEPQSLYDSIKRESKPHSIGYITDVGFTKENFEIISRLMGDLTLLVCECTYLKENKEKARLSFHLCTDDVKQLVLALKPTYLLPMHLSKTYLRQSEAFYRQLDTQIDCQLIRLPDRMTLPPQLPKELSSLIQ